MTTGMLHDLGHGSPPQSTRLADRARREMLNCAISLVVLGYPISAMLVSLLGVDSTLVTTPFRVGILVLAVCILATGLQSRLPGTLDPWLAIFLGLYFFRLTYDWQLGGLPDASETWRFYVVATLVPTVAISLGVRGDLDESALLRRFMAFGALFCVLLSLAWYQGLSFNVTGDDLESREAFAALGPISLGHASASVAICALVLLTQRVSLAWRALASISGFVAVAGLAASASRGPLIAFGIAVLWYATFRRSRIVIAVLMLVGGFIVLSLDSFALQRVSEILTLDANQLDASALQRLVIQSTAIKDLLQNPIFGKHFLDPDWGPGYYPHNITIEAGMALGFTGLVVLLAVYARLWWAIVRGVSITHPIIVLLLVQYLVGAQASGTISGSDRFFVLSGICLSLGWSLRQSKRLRRREGLL